MAKIVKRKKDLEIAKMNKNMQKIGQSLTVFEMGIPMCAIVCFL